MNRRVLWADDEIELLKSHIIFLDKKGYEVTPVSNGEDAIAMARTEKYDAVLLDEMMPGMDGLAVLTEMKNIDPTLPVIMITKSEEDHIMDEALGSRISDYLIKPVSPTQIYTTLKRLLDTRALRSERVSREYARQANQNRMDVAMGLDYDGWANVHQRLSVWDMEITEYNDPGLNQIHADQRREFRHEFTRYVEKHYRSWLGDEGPLMSHQVMDKYVAPLLKNGEKVYFIVIDCFRYDHWLAIEPKLEELFSIDRSYYYSILPTATPFCRNALFAGMMPDAIAEVFPEIWRNMGHDEIGMNTHEPELLERYLHTKGIGLPKPPAFVKLAAAEDSQEFYRRMDSLHGHRLITMVYNFIDFLSHQVAESDILQEIAPDEAAFRSLTTAWFNHSVLLDILKSIAAEGATVVMTTDHGSITGERASIVRGDRTTSTNVRYKYGRNLKCDTSQVMYVDTPAEYGLPDVGLGTNYLFAKEDYYLIYQNKHRHYEKLYQKTFQHGGISMEEMILPIGVLRPR